MTRRARGLLVGSGKWKEERFFVNVNVKV